MALLAVTSVDRSGVRTDDGAAADVAGDTFPNTGQEYFHVANGSGVSVDATIDVVAALDGQAVADKVVTVAAGQAKIIGPFPKGVYNDANAHVKVTCNPITTVKVKALKFTQS